MTTSGTFTVLSTFDDVAAARQAVAMLEKEGFLPGKMRIEPAASDEQAGSGLTQPAPKHGLARIERFFERLLGRGDQAQHAADYGAAVRGGRCVAIVDTSSEVSAERAATVMQDLGGYDLTERCRAEREGGWSAASAGAHHLSDGTVVQWRAAHVVHRASAEPLSDFAGDD